MITFNWEIRAKERRLENKALKKRIKELTISRNKWKVKFMEQKDILKTMKNSVETIKKNVQKIIQA